MSLKWIGAICIIVGCGGWGFIMAAYYHSRIRMLRQMISALEFMQYEIRYRHTPLPELFMSAGQMVSGKLRQVYIEIGKELSTQILPNASLCVNIAVEKSPELPICIKECILDIGKTLGRFDVDGQVWGLEVAAQGCERQLKALTDNKDMRVRGYQTLGLCAGAAVAILLV